MAKEAKWFKTLVKVEHVLTNGIGWLCAAWFSAMILCMVWQVISRFVLNLSVPWTDEASRYLWITITFIGAGAALSEGAHVEINIIASFLKKMDHDKKMKWARISDIVRYIIILFLGIFLVYNFFTFSKRVIALGQVSAAMLIPMAVPYIIIDVGLISVVLHTLFRLIISFVDHESIVDSQILKAGEE